MSATIFSQRCRHADGGSRISGRRQLVQRGGMPAPNAAMSASVVVVVCHPPTAAIRRRPLAGTRASLARRGRGGGGERRRDAQDEPSTVSLRVRAPDQKSAGSPSRSGIALMKSSADRRRATGHAGYRVGSRGDPSRSAPCDSLDSSIPRSRIPRSERRVARAAISSIATGSITEINYQHQLRRIPSVRRAVADDVHG